MMIDKPLLSVVHAAIIQNIESAKLISDFNLQASAEQSIRAITTPTTEPCGTNSFCGLAATFDDINKLRYFSNEACQELVAIEIDGSEPQSAANDLTITDNDGEYIYTVSGVILSVVKASPSNQIQVISTKKLANIPSRMFKDGNYLTVLGTLYEKPYLNQSDSSNFGDDIVPFYPEGSQTQSKGIPYTWVRIYEISTNKNLQIVKDYKMEGEYIKASKDEDTGFLYVFSQNSCLWLEVFPWFEVNNARTSVDINKFFYYTKTDYTLGAIEINILALNIRNPLQSQNNMITVLSPREYILYVSGPSFYLTSRENIRGVDHTKIHKIFASGSRIIPMADTAVNGFAKNKMFFKQKNGNLRISTVETTNGVKSSSIFSLDFNLKTLGKVRGFASGSDIDTVLYTKTRVYFGTLNNNVCTFFVIDLTNSIPNNLGQFKILDYSSYVYPYDATTILTFGQTTNDPSQALKFRVSLFDVTSITKPKRIADYVLPQSYNYLSVDWKNPAFLLERQNNLLVIQAKHQNASGTSNGQNSLNGVLVFDIVKATRSSIVLRAIVNHLMKNKDLFAQRSVQKSLKIGNLLYTKSDALLRVHDFKALNGLVNLELNCEFDPSALKTCAAPNTNRLRPLQLSGSVQVI